MCFEEEAGADCVARHSAINAAAGRRSTSEPAKRMCFAGSRFGRLSGSVATSEWLRGGSRAVEKRSQSEREVVVERERREEEEEVVEEGR